MINLWYASLKLMPRFENPSVTGPEFREKCKRGRPKRERGRSKCEHGRYVSETASRFRNLCVYEPSTLRKKFFRFSEEAFRFFGKNFPILGRSLPIFGRSLPVSDGVAPQTHFGKAFRIAASILKMRTIYPYACDMEARTLLHILSGLGTKLSTMLSNTSYCTWSVVHTVTMISEYSVRS